MRTGRLEETPLSPRERVKIVKVIKGRRHKGFLKGTVISDNPKAGKTFVLIDSHGIPEFVDRYRIHKWISGNARAQEEISKRKRNEKACHVR